MTNYNKLISVFASILLVLSIAGVSFSAEESAGKKSEAKTSEQNTLSKEDAMADLKELAPDIKVLEVHPSPVADLWEVDVESGGRKGILYLDSSGKYMIQGVIVDLETKSNLTKDRYGEVVKKYGEFGKVDLSQIPLDDAIVMGDKNAAHRVIIFSDPKCPYCEKLHQEMKKVIKKRKDIVFFIKMYPLPMHKGSYEEAKAIVCAKSLALLDDAFAKKPVPAAKCETKAVDDNIKLAEKLGIRGTPAVILPDGTLIPGFKEADALIADIDKHSKPQ
jgi:thiol:disulfide interchange protein DsbC